MKRLIVLLAIMFMLGFIGISQAEDKYKITPKITPEIIFVPIDRPMLRPEVMPAPISRPVVKSY